MHGLEMHIQQFFVLVSPQECKKNDLFFKFLSPNITMDIPVNLDEIMANIKIKNRPSGKRLTPPRVLPELTDRKKPSEVSTPNVDTYRRLTPPSQVRISSRVTPPSVNYRQLTPPPEIRTSSRVTPADDREDGVPSSSRSSTVIKPGNMRIVSKSTSDVSVRENSSPRTPPRNQSVTPARDTDIVLTQEQSEHLDRLIEMMSIRRSIMDTSSTGCGKTITSLALQMHLDIPVIVFCQKTAKGHWLRTAERMGTSIFITSTYESMRVGSNVKGDNPLLPYIRKVRTQSVTDDGDVIIQDEYRLTQEWFDLVDDGIMIIFDESQKIKNNNATTTLAHQLILSIVEHKDPNNRSRVLQTSATPFDKQELVVNVMKTFGIYTNLKMSRNDIQRGMMYEGFIEIMEKIRKIAPHADLSTAEELMSRSGVVKSIKGILFQWYVDYIAPIHTLSMRPLDSKPVLEASYLPIDPIKGILAGDIIKSMMDIVHYDPETGEIETNLDANTRSKVLTLIHDLEVYKIRDAIVPEARKILTTKSKDKIVIFVNGVSKGQVDIVKNELGKFGVVHIQGDMNVTQRNHNINRFQTQDTCRVFVSTIGTGASSISLDDTVGDSPRHCFIIPSYSIQNLHQAKGRIDRVTTASIPTIKLVYLNLDINEQKLLDALARKTEVYKKTLTNANNEGKIVYPGDYPEVRYGTIVNVLNVH